MTIPMTTGPISMRPRLLPASSRLLFVLFVALSCSGAQSGPGGDAAQPEDGVDTYQDVAADLSGQADARHENHVPYMEPIGDRSLVAGELAVIAIEADDPDHDPLTYFMAGSLPDGARFDRQKGVFTWTPQKAQVGLEVMLTFGVSDGHEQVSETIMVNVVAKSENHAPVLQPIGTLTVEPGKEFTYRLRATDPDGDELHFSISGPRPPGSHLDKEKGVFTWDVPADATGKSFVVVFTVTDGRMTDTAEVKLVVGKAGKNRPPQVKDPGVLHFTPGQDNHYQVEATDPDGDKLTYSLAKPEMAPKGLAMDASGMLRWKPSRDWSGLKVTVQGEVTDGEYKVVFDIPVQVMDPYPPLIQPLGKPDIKAGRADLYFTITDEGGISRADLTFHTDIQSHDNTVDLVNLDGPIYGVSVNVGKAKQLSIMCQATDRAGNKTRFPETGYQTIPLAVECPKPDHPVFVRVYYDTLGENEALEEFIWLYNPTDRAVDVSGWALADNNGNGNWYFMPANMTIDAHGYLQLARNLDGYGNLFDQKLVPDVDDLNLNLTNRGDALVLVDKDANIVDQVCWEGGAKAGCPEGWKGRVWADAGKALMRGTYGPDGYEFRICDTDTAYDWTSDLYNAPPLPKL